MVCVLLVHKEQAVQWYKRGIAELERGIAIKVAENGELTVPTFAVFCIP